MRRVVSAILLFSAPIAIAQNAPPQRGNGVMPGAQAAPSRRGSEVPLDAQAAASAPLGGYRLYSQKGQLITTPSDIASSIPWDQLPADKTGLKFVSLNGLLARSVNKIQSIIRQEPPDDATSAQRADMADSKYQKMSEEVGKLPDTPVSASFTVLDVLTYPQHDDPGHGRFLVIGEFPWKADAEYAPEERKQIVAINNDCDAQEASDHQSYEAANAQMTTNEAAARQAGLAIRDSQGRNQLQQDWAEKKQETEATRRNSLSRIRTNADARTPRHMVYCWSDDPGLMTWRQGQTRSVKGVVQTAGAFLFTDGKLVEAPKGTHEPLEDAAVSMEFIVRAFKADSPILHALPAVPTTQPNSG
jgi:hypothetical protein